MRVVYARTASNELEDIWLDNAEKVETEHLLLGIVREPDGVAGRVLDLFGVKAFELHEAIKGLPSDPPG